jgi:nonsense-mediated mRNA decay protein 3
MFCVECGADGPTYEGLCVRCFDKKYRVVEPPAFLDATRCQSCGAIRFKGGWFRTGLEFATARLLQEAVPRRPPYERVSFTHTAREEDPNNFLLTVKAVGRHQDFKIVQDFHTRLRIQPGICDTCQKQRGHYYEGILQVRGEGRELTPREIRDVRTFVAARIDRAHDPTSFVSRVEQEHGGLDFYVSTNALGRNLAREISEAFGGRVSSSPKLFGQRGGKELYRVTSLVRLSPFGIGDVVRHKGLIAEVTAVGPFVVLRDLVSGEERRFKPRDLRSVRRVEAERFEGRIERLPLGEWTAVHPETGEERPLRSKGPAPGRGAVVWTRDEAFLSVLPPDPSKD